MSLFGSPKANQGTLEEVGKMIEIYFHERHLDANDYKISNSEGYGWWLNEGSAKVYIFLVELPSGPVIRITSPLVKIPAQNKEAFYRHLLDLNSRLSNCALATFEDSVLVVNQRSTIALDQEELDSMVWNVAYVADLLDNKLASQFGTQLYSQ
jgi:hypothetical protein